MKTIGVRINQSKKNPETELEQYIIRQVKSGLSKDKTEAIKDGLYKAIDYDKLNNKYEKLQEELKNKERNIQVLYDVISKLKGQPVYIQQNIPNNNQQNEPNNNFNLDIDITDDEELITVTEKEMSEEDLEKEFMSKFG